MTSNQLLEAYRTFAAADAEADARFDLLDFPNLPERPVMSIEALAGEVIHRRGGLEAALVEARHGVEDPDCREDLKEAYQIIIEATR